VTISLNLRDEGEPIAPAAPAATVVVVRDVAGGEGGVEIFMVRRPERAAFMAGAYVFPGGRVDPDDATEDVNRWCDGADEAAARLPDLRPADAIAYFIAAVRELFEESGLLLARDDAGEIVRLEHDAEARLDRARAALLARERGLREIASDEGLRLALDLLTPFAHWVTPEAERRRFDARFFVAQAPAGQRLRHDEVETTDGVWITAADALMRSERGDMTLGPPTLRTLEELAEVRSVRGVLEWARTRPRFRILPRLVIQGGVRILALPGDPLNPALPDVTVAGPSRFVEEGQRWVSRWPD
jgi:8-oxo-dGTP pyrophosphatase MutT (NUDIX family)